MKIQSICRAVLYGLIFNLIVLVLSDYHNYSIADEGREWGELEKGANGNGIGNSGHKWQTGV